MAPAGSAVGGNLVGRHCLCVGVVFTRAEPAIAFAERGWVVVGDLRNLTGNTLLDSSLEQALRISLEQSRYVNVLSDMKVRDTMTRMKRDPDSVVVDRAIASEVAMRDGASAVILPTVAEIGASSASVWSWWIHARRPRCTRSLCKAMAYRPRCRP